MPNALVPEVSCLSLVRGIVLLVAGTYCQGESDVHS